MDQKEKILWQNYWENGDQAKLIKLLNHYITLIKDAANRICSDDSGVGMDDLMGAGVFALSDAVKSYLPNSQIEFEEHCMPLVEQAMLKEFSWANSDMGQAWGKLTRQEKLIVVLRYHEDCSFSDISSLLDMTLDKVKYTYHSAVSSLPPLTDSQVGPG